jgi:hypothetical protein
LAIPASAPAQDDSAIGQYIENVPGAGGDEPSEDVEAGGGGSGGRGSGGGSGGSGSGGGSGGSGSGGGEGSGAGEAAGVPSSPTNEAAPQAAGETAAAAADLAEATAPEQSAGSGSERSASARSDHGSGGGSSTAKGTENGGPPVGDVLGTGFGDSDSGGLGLALPIILGAALLAAIAFWLLRRRRATLSQP